VAEWFFPHRFPEDGAPLGRPVDYIKNRLTNGIVSEKGEGIRKGH
jgi:hypothetical protein